MYILYNKAMLRDRHNYTCNINLLKAVLSKKRNTYVCSDCNKWN